MTRQAYKHSSHFRFGNPGGLGSNFDVTWLYEWWSKHTLAELLLQLDEKGEKPLWTEEQLDGIRCVKLQYDLEKEREMVLWLAPDMSYSLVSGRFFHKNKPNLGSSYQASYKESSEFKGVWLLNELELIDNQGLRNQSLKVVFKDVNVGVSVPDEMFILEAIGIKKGTTIIDKRSEEPVDFAPPESATVNETIWTPFELNENVADVKALVEAIETSYAARNQLLRYSTGSAEAEFERVYD
ncbi:MAG: hypothetical protein KAJ01_02820 [Candidatus Hydrogenedentes bacterium]|nr:hypothetical protein [Candidatus Hydrogenedentota bacterium]